MEEKDIEKTQSQPASSETTAKVEKPVEKVASTPTYEIEVESSDDSAQNDKPQTDTIEKPAEAASPTAEEGKDQEGKQRNIQAEIGKMSALEREKNERTKELELERKTRTELERKLKEVEGKANGFEALEKEFRTKPALYEGFRNMLAESGGVILPEHSQVYGSFTQQNYQQQVPIDPVAIKEEAKQEMREEFRLEAEATTGFQSFIAKHPEMDPHKLSPEESTEAGIVFGKVRELVPALQKVYPDASMGDILEYAYSALPEVREIQSAKTKEINELSGMAKAYSKGVAGSDGMSGGGSSGVGSTIKVNLTAAEKVHYDRLSVSSPKIAQIYLQKIADR